MKTLKHLLHNKKAKTSNATVIILILIIAGAFLYFGGYLDNINLPQFSMSGTSTGTGNLVSVNKKVQFNVKDYYAGTAANAKTLYVYDPNTLALLDTLTTSSSGIIQTTNIYPSGTKLAVKFVDSNSKKWFDVTVPKMTASDAEANTYNDVSLSTFAIGTYSSDSMTAPNGTAITDNASYNYTSATTPTFTYVLRNTGSDNTGLMESYDPVYQCAYDVWIQIKISAGTWDTVVLSGVDRIDMIGSAYYGYKHLSATELTKWKIGNNYVAGYEGTQTVSWSLDLTGTTGSSVVMQVEVYAYADPSYAATHGANMGPGKVEIAEQTVRIIA